MATTRADVSPAPSTAPVTEDDFWPPGDTTRNVIPRRSASSRASSVISVSSVMASSPFCGTRSKSASVIRGFMRGGPGKAATAVLGLRRRQRKHAYVLEVAIALRVVQPVSDDEFVGNLEPDVIRLYVFLDAPLRLVEKRGDLQRIRFALLQNTQQISEREPGVQNIFHHDDVEPFDAGVQILVEPHLAGRLAAVPVAGDGHEIHGNFHANLAHQIGKKNGRALQDSDQMDALALVVLGDLRAHFAHALLDGAAAKQHLQVFLAMTVH